MEMTGFGCCQANAQDSRASRTDVGGLLDEQLLFKIQAFI